MRWLICYFVWCALMLASVYGYAWHHYKQDCMALYGVGSKQDNTELFINCTKENVAMAFGTQFVAIVLLPVMMLLAWSSEKIWYWFLFTWPMGRRSK
jgi:hypothetical protein